MRSSTDGAEVKVKPLILHEFPLDKIILAFEVRTEPSESVKVMVNP